jgi:probable HAF family extracellular repeat protein
MPIKLAPALHFASLSLACSLVLGARAQTYTLTDLGSSAYYYSEAHGLNGYGHVVGEYEPTNSINVRGFYFDGATLIDVGSLPGPPYAVAYGNNDTNEVVGESEAAHNTHAFLYSNGTMTDLGVLGGHINEGGYSSAHAINRLQQIVGESSVSFAQAGTIHAVLYDHGAATDLGALGGDYSAAFAVNNSGVVVGESDEVEPGVTNVHAFIYSGGTMRDLGTLGGSYSSAKAINDSSLVVGEAETVILGITYLRAFLYNGSSMTDVGTLGGSTSSASAINSSGQIVGYAYDANELPNAFLYDGSHMINLSALIPASSSFTNLASADAINDAGQIAGSGYTADNEYHAYLLTPIVNHQPPSPFSLSSPSPLPDGRSFSFPTQTGYTYDAQYANDLAAPVQWITFTNVAGNGSVITVTDTSAGTDTRFYRVLAH